MNDRGAAMDVVVRSWSIIDRRGGEGVSEFFTPDGAIVFGSATNSGKAEIDLVYAQRRARGERLSRHVVTNLLVDDSADGWRAEYVLILYAADGRPVIPTTIPVAIFDVIDDLTGLGPGPGPAPLIRRRTMTQLFAEPGATLAVSFDRPATQLENSKHDDEEGR